jgi:hypothetical protein
VAFLAHDDVEARFHGAMGKSSDEVCDIGEISHQNQWGIYNLHYPTKRVVPE